MAPSVTAGRRQRQHLKSPAKIDSMRIHQSADHLSDTLQAVLDGRLVPAAFQRPYVWSQSDVTALWESLLNGWPIGSFLIWKPGAGVDLAKAGRSRLGPIQAAGASRWTGMILDGQQRLTTLAWSFLAADAARPDPMSLFDAERATWAGDDVIVADGEQRRVLWVPKSDASSGWRIPVGLLGDLALLLPALNALVSKHQGQIPKDVFDWFDAASHAVRSAKITTTTIEDATPQEAVTAFAHVARVGVPVTPDEVAAALAWAAP